MDQGQGHISSKRNPWQVLSFLDSSSFLQDQQKSLRLAADNYKEMSTHLIKSWRLKCRPDN